MCRRRRSGGDGSVTPGRLHRVESRGIPGRSRLSERRLPLPLVTLRYPSTRHGACPRSQVLEERREVLLERGLPTAVPKKLSRRLATHHRCALWQHSPGEGTNEVTNLEVVSRSALPDGGGHGKRCEDLLQREGLHRRRRPGSGAVPDRAGRGGFGARPVQRLPASPGAAHHRRPVQRQHRLPGRHRRVLRGDRPRNDRWPSGRGERPRRSRPRGHRRLQRHLPPRRGGDLQGGQGVHARRGPDAAPVPDAQRAHLGKQVRDRQQLHLVLLAQQPARHP